MAATSRATPTMDETVGPVRGHADIENHVLEQLESVRELFSQVEVHGKDHDPRGCRSPIPSSSSEQSMPSDWSPRIPELRIT